MEKEKKKKTTKDLEPCSFEINTSEEEDTYDFKNEVDTQKN
jgi:hypothetical protein